MMIYRFFNFLWQIFFFLMLLFFAIISFVSLYANIVNFHILKNGIITDVHKVVTQSEEGLYQVHFNYHYVTKGANNILSDSTYEEIQKGDEISYRFRGKHRRFSFTQQNVIYAINGKRVASKYDFFDLFAPMLLYFSVFLIYKVFIRNIFNFNK